MICKCKRPANPDNILIGCTNPQCRKWLHYDCLLDDVLTSVYERLGTTKPHVSKNGDVKTEKEEEKNGTKLDSMATPNGDVKDVKPMIDVQGGETMDNVSVKELDEASPKKLETPPATSLSSAPLPNSNKPSAEKRGRKKKTMDGKPYYGLFEASLKMNDGPMLWKIRDLRENVSGGDRAWTERAQCPICRTIID